jgi:starch synthase
MRILFATPEVSDFVQVGGLAAVSAALPRALRAFADIRVVIPGYSEVLARLENLTIITSYPSFAGLPAFEVGFGRAADGLPYYVVVCPGLFERVGSPYGDERGVDWSDNDVRFATFSYAAAEIASGRIDKFWSADLVHANWYTKASLHQAGRCRTGELRLRKLVEDFAECRTEPGRPSSQIERMVANARLQLE